MLAVLDRDATLIAGPTRLSGEAVDLDSWNIAPGPDGWAVVWSERERAYLRRVTIDGSPIGATVDLLAHRSARVTEPHAAVVAGADGGWDVALSWPLALQHVPALDVDPLPAARTLGTERCDDVVVARAPSGELAIYCGGLPDELVELRDGAVVRRIAVVSGLDARLFHDGTSWVLVSREGRWPSEQLVVRRGPTLEARAVVHAESAGLGAFDAELRGTLLTVAYGDSSLAQLDMPTSADAAPVLRAYVDQAVRDGSPAHRPHVASGSAAGGMLVWSTEPDGHELRAARFSLEGCE